MKKLVIIFLAGFVAWFIYIFLPSKLKKPETYLTQFKVTHICVILKSPKQYNGQMVSIEGKVIRSISIGLKVYEIDDGTGKIFVRSDSAVPLEGQTIKVEGRVNQVFKLFEKHVVLVEETAS